MTVHPAFVAAERLAPKPERREDATREQWIRYYAARGLAAYTALHDAIDSLPADPEPGSRPDLGLLTAAATAATGLATTLAVPGGNVGGWLWDITPECGAFNGEYLEVLANTLDQHGINPADIDPEYGAADFNSASQPITEGAPTP